MNRILFRTLPVLILFCMIGSCSPKLKNQFKKQDVFKQAFTGFALYDPVSQKSLYTLNADKYFTPASNIKLFTLYTGLKILGDSVPALKYSLQNDSLIFKGTGDPAFLHPELPPSRVADFLKENENQLFYVPPSYKEAPLGPGWAWDDYNYAFSAERNDLPVYGNLIKFELDKNSNPIIHPQIFRDSIKGIEQNTNIQNTKRELGSNKISYPEMDRKEKVIQNIPFKTSPELTIKLLSDTLDKNVRIYQGSTHNLSLDNTLYSIPTDSLYKRMMHKSDNFIAEQILLMAADKVSDSLKTLAAIDHMKKIHLRDLPDEPFWVDGSGLSRYNLATPNTMVKLLEKIQREMFQEKLFEILPAGGRSGTLLNDYKAGKPYIYAKTGTLRNNHSLSGFIITNKGRILIFSFMNNNYTVPTSEIKTGMTGILEFIRDNY